MSKKRGFTLVEMLLVIVISGSLFTTIYAIMTTLPKVKIFNDARQQLIEQTNDVMNRFALLIQDYTVDYEEYYNRSQVGTSLSEQGNYSDFTWYGNHGFVQGVDQRFHYIKYFAGKSNNSLNITDKPLSYGQYKAMFRNMGNDTDGQGRINPNVGTSVPTFANVGDADDKDLGTGPKAISDLDSIKELYLISHDGKRRLFLRRNKICGKDNDPKTCSFTIQILKLRGFDAGTQHVFDPKDGKTYDGEIDTWACDAGEGFFCHGQAIENTIYPKYKLPNDINDGWINLFDGAISIEDWNIKIFPSKNPDYAWDENEEQINPYITIGIKSKLVPSFWQKKLGKVLNDYSFTLQTSFDTKSFYTQ